MINPFHPNISKGILYTVPYTFTKVLTKRIYVKVNSFFSC